MDRTAELAARLAALQARSAASDAAARAALDQLLKDGRDLIAAMDRLADTIEDKE